MHPLGTCVAALAGGAGIVKGHVVKLPPFGKQWLAEPPSAGLVVAFGADAWGFARSRAFPCLVLPDDEPASTFDWRAFTGIKSGPALIHECGAGNEGLLDELARELMRAGAPTIVAIRHSRLHTDSRVFYVPGDGHG